MGLFRLAADKVAYIFGVRVTKRLRGKLHSVLEKLDHGHHVLRIYCKNLVGRMYEKFSTFLRVEVCVNRMKDLGLNKGLENLECLRQKLVAITDRFAGFEAQSLNVHVDFPLFQRMALPVMAGKTKIAGIKIHDTRMMRLMEVLLRGGTQLNGWRSADIHQAILTTFGLSASAYTLTQLRYDLRKMKAHGLLERIGRGYCYRLTDKGTKAALMFILFHKRVCGPLANSLFHHRPRRNPQACQQGRSRLSQGRSCHSTGSPPARGVRISERRILRLAVLETSERCAAPLAIQGEAVDVPYGSLRLGHVIIFFQPVHDSRDTVLNQRYLEVDQPLISGRSSRISTKGF